MVRTGGHLSALGLLLFFAADVFLWWAVMRGLPIIVRRGEIRSHMLRWRIAYRSKDPVTFWFRIVLMVLLPVIGTAGFVLETLDWFSRMPISD